jgi:hypothetical protein
MTGPAALVFYTREGCHLCERFLLEFSLDFPAAADELTVRDVDTVPAWAVDYGLRVPVLVTDGDVVCEGRYDRARVGAVLGL